MPKEAQNFYDTLFKSVPKGYIEGNGSQTIGYTANGEASDWMLHELGIYALSPELGILNQLVETFFITNKVALEDLLIENYDWIKEAMRLLFEKVECKHTYSEVSKIYIDAQTKKEFSEVQSDFSCTNFGLKDSKQGRLLLYKNPTYPLEVIEVYENN